MVWEWGIRWFKDWAQKIRVGLPEDSDASEGVT